MKRIIEIPDNFDLENEINIVSNPVIRKALKNGIPLPDNATNGDVIKALFPEFRIDEMSYSVWVGYNNMSFRRDWWNAPYKTESENDG